MYAIAYSSDACRSMQARKHEVDMLCSFTPTTQSTVDYLIERQFKALTV